MDLFFANPNEVPVPPENMEIRSLTANPYPDGKRVSVVFEISPFQQRPNIEITITNQEDHLVASLSVVEAIENKMNFTLHLREPEPSSNYKVNMELFYTDLTSMDDDADQLIKDVIIENKKNIVSSQTAFQIVSTDGP